MTEIITRWDPRVQLSTHLPSRQPINRATYSAYRLWAKRYPQWAAAFFDEQFLRVRVLPLLRAEGMITPTALAQTWVAQFHNGIYREQELVAELTPVAADFLYFVAGELRYFEREASRPSALRRLWSWVQGATQRHGRAKELSVLYSDLPGKGGAG